MLAALIIRTTMIGIQAITHLTADVIQPLLDVSVAEGYSFVQRLWDEYQSGFNTFSDGGALLLGVFDDGVLIAIGGVHPDPYLNNPAIGRIRHVYVLPQQRRRGIAGTLVQALMERTSDTFTTFTLRTLTDHGRAFYADLGFSDAPRFPDATHWREFRPQLLP
jgi:GNAT superfamily N-acetyltransferase